MRAKKPIIKQEELGVNLLIHSLVIPVTKYSNNSAILKVDKDKSPEFLLDNFASTKLFNCAENRLLLNKLTDKAARLLIWLAYSIEPGKDYIWINKSRYMEERGIKAITTITEALKELHKQSVINPTPIKDVYWINPNIFFNGNRIEKYPSHVKVIHDYTPNTNPIIIDTNEI